MKNRQAIKGEGCMLLRGKEYPVTYRIEVQRSSQALSARGLADGLDLIDVDELQRHQGVKLRLADGTEVDIAFLGGVLDGPQKFVVNSRLPGL